MAKPRLSLQPSEAVVTQCASTIFAAYISSGRVPDGSEEKWIQRSIREAYLIAKLTDDSIQSDTELG